jgi:carbamoyltransferase
MNPRAKDDLNSRVKKRESFRPYGPSVLQEEAAKWFDLAKSSYMLLEAKVHPDKTAIVPAIVHVDGTSRPQTVSEAENPRYYRLIKKVYEMTGVPMVLNTSFNMHGEPIVNSPDEAILDLLNTGMDALFIDNYYINKK